jgi:DNA-binding IclR family transcriptional regulator
VLGTEQITEPQRKHVHIGERAPLTSGCSGRVILAHLPANEADAVVTGHRLGSRRARLQRELDIIRADGYALSFSENRPSFNGIGAALLDLDTGYPLGSMAIAGPDEQLPEAALRTLARPLIAACDGLAPYFSALLGPNSSARREALDVTIQDLVAAARG